MAGPFTGVGLDLLHDIINVAPTKIIERNKYVNFFMWIKFMGKTSLFRKFMHIANIGNNHFNSNKNSTTREQKESGLTGRPDNPGMSPGTIYDDAMPWASG